MKREIIATNKAPAAVGPYSQAVRAGDLLFTAGQIALDPATGRLVEGGIEDQTRRVLTNLSAVLEAAGTSLSHVVKTTVFLTDMGEFKAMNGVYAEFFPDAPPARSTVQVAALPLGSRVEIEAVAIIS
jgi:2-iminobutanoate/2-iminopropanoate deaminase